MFFSFLKCAPFFFFLVSVVPHQTKLGGDCRENEKLKGKQMRKGVKEFNCAFLIFLKLLFRQIMNHLNMVFECIQQCEELDLF